MGSTLAVVLGLSLAAPVPKLASKYETHRFTLADDLKKPTWELNYELLWKPNPDAAGGLEIVAWGLADSVNGNTREGWIKTLFMGKKIGDVVTLKTPGENLGMASEFTPLDKTRQKDRLRFDKEFVTSSDFCFHEVEAQLAVWWSSDKTFDFDARGKGDAIDDFGLLRRTVGIIGSGTLRISVAKQPQTDEFYVKAWATWVKDFGTVRQQHTKWDESGRSQQGKSFQHEWRSVNIPSGR
jgi:hypothetical protein